MTRKIDETIITPLLIKQLCGRASYSRGMEYYETGRVLHLAYDSDNQIYNGIVKGSGRNKYEVDIYEISEDGIDAHCACPAFAMNECKHIAAVLLAIMDLEINRPPDDDALVASKELEELLFALQPIGSAAEPPPTPKQTVNVEFILNATEGFYGAPGKLALEMKIGKERLYVVQAVKTLLLKMSRGESHMFSKNFTYDPMQHVLHPIDREIVDILIQIAWQEEEMLPRWGGGSSSGNGRSLLLPPLAFDLLLPKLIAAGALVHVGGRKAGTLREGDPDQLSVQFQLLTAEDGYRLSVDGFENWLLLERHGVAINMKGELVRVDSSKQQALRRLKDTSFSKENRPLRLSDAQLRPFLERNLPRLERLGRVQVEERLADRIVHKALTAKLFLDMEDGELTAKVEFWYGDAKYDPFEAPPADEHRIVVRDEEREKALLDRLGDCGFAFRAGTFRLTEEDDIYAFLHRHVSNVEQLAELYAAPAVRSHLRPQPYRPKIHADLDGGMDWLEIRFEIDGLEEADIRKVMKAVQEKKKYVRLPSGAFLSLETEEFRLAADVIERLNVRRGEWKTTKLRRPKIQGLLLEELQEGQQQLSLGKALRKLVHHLKQPDQAPFEPPASLQPTLRDYQRYGFQWFKTLAMYGFGGIMADDMGLGKTLQAIAFLLSEHGEGERDGPPSLVVAPSSLIYNWRSEFSKFAPSLRVVVLAGTKVERAELLRDAANADVLVTSYPLLRRDIEAYGDMPFHVLVLDEAQAIKNDASVTAQAVQLLQARHRFALTGTPIENSLDELHAIMGAVFPGLFPGKNEFHRLSREAVARRVKPFLLRRLKRDVLTELPEKIETLHVSEMTLPQKTLYLGYWSKLQEETAKSLSEEGFQMSRMKILAGLTRLRQLCCHPGLFVENYAGGSGKLAQLLELLAECFAGGKRVLLFSQFTSMLKIIKQEAEGRGWEPFYLDGSTPSIERVDMCDRFNAGERELFLISLKAGGTGLNLTGADTVILYDLWWNPAVEQQAADRAHRMGQKHVVQVIRLITEGTIEEKMYELQQRKRELINDILEPAGASGGAPALTEQDIRELLMI